MKILSIETSCDDTGIALLEATGPLETPVLEVLGNSLYSQAALHSAYGGVYPSLAKREHQNNLAPLTVSALSDAGLYEKQEPETVPEEALLTIRDPHFKEAVQKFLETTQKPAIDLIAVTKGPGLEPALWTGINFAESIGRHWGIPVVGIDHMEGHIMAALLKNVGGAKWHLENFTTPLLALLISGGHTEFVLMKKYFEYTHIGATRDDAVGEAFDKVARLLELPYPGGPHIANAATRSRTRNEKHGIVFPRPMAHDATCDFSFSGLKTAVLYKLREMDAITENQKEHIAEAFEDAARDIVVIKARRALEQTNPRVFAIGGGVSANDEIRQGLKTLIEAEFPETVVTFPDKTLTGDNAIMIGAAAYVRHTGGVLREETLTAFGNLKL